MFFSGVTVIILCPLLLRIAIETLNAIYNKQMHGIFVIN